MSAEGRCYIDGQWVEASTTFPVANPATGEEIGRAADADAALATTAVAAADGALAAWAARPAPERAAALRRITAALLADIDRIADLIVAEQGKPRGQALFEVNYATQWLDWFAEEARRVYGEIIPASFPGKRLHVQRKPLGVAVAITPWNFPLAMIARKLAPALAAGCTMVVKGAEQTPLSPAALFEAIHSAELPPGVVNLVSASDPERVSEALLEDPRVRKITFTGSTEVGKLLVRASAKNLARVSLELGGQAPFIVFDDADLDAAVTGVLASKFQVNGQSCLCANRVFVQRGVTERFSDLLTGAVRDLNVGNGAEQGIDIGPLIDDRGFAKVEAHVADAVAQGATVLVGGERAVGGDLDRGYFYAPTVLDACTDSMLVAREETFGPVAPLLPFETEAEVVERANATPYGLAGYLYTTDLGRAMRVSEALEFGIVGVNDALPASPTAPFGGFKQSGLGREGGHEGIDAFVESKLVSIVV